RSEWPQVVERHHARSAALRHPDETAARVAVRKCRLFQHVQNRLSRRREIPAPGKEWLSARRAERRHQDSGASAVTRSGDTRATAAVRSSLSQANGLPSMARFRVLNSTAEKSWR